MDWVCGNVFQQQKDTAVADAGSHLISNPSQNVEAWFYEFKDIWI